MRADQEESVHRVWLVFKVEQRPVKSDGAGRKVGSRVRQARACRG